MEMAIERQLNTVVGANLFAEQPPYLNSFFRFQLGSNTFDGVSLPLSLSPARCTCAGTFTLTLGVARFVRNGSKPSPSTSARGQCNE